MKKGVVEKTEQEKRTEEEAKLHLKKLEEKLKYYKQVVMNSSDAIIIQDFNGIITAWNRAAENIYGFSEKEMIGKSIIKIISEEYQAEARKNIESIKQGKPVFKVRQIRETKKGKKLFMNITYSPIFENEEIIEIGTTEENISEKIEAEEEFGKSFRKLNIASEEKLGDISSSIRQIREQTEKNEDIQEKISRFEKLAALGRITGILGHELRNPLSAIRNSAYYLSGLKFKNNVVKKYIRIMNEEAINAENVINGIFLFAKMQKLRKIKLDINKKIKRIIKEFNLPEEIKVIYKLDDVPLMKMVDLHITQIIKNLVSNSVEAMSKGGIITIETHRKDNNIEIIITDTGKGISEENLKKILTPLFSTKYKGTGLGLSVCQYILEFYDGTIKFKSEIGKGTEVTIQIPLKGGAK